MIELRDCIVGVKDVKEYEKVIQIAKEQGCEWNSGDSLDYIYCTFPTRLFFDKRGRVTFGGYHEKYCDYHCKNLMSRLQELIIIRQKGKLFKILETWGLANCALMNMFDIKFDFIKWEDEEPWSIEDLKNLEVRDDGKG